MPSLPPARKPVLQVKATYTYTVRILDATLTTDVPGDNPPPAGTKALALLLRVEAEPRDRSIKAPYANLGITYPSLDADKDARIGGVMDGATPYLTEDQLLFGDDGARGVSPMFGALEANTVYYHLAWQIVSEDADLTGASLCEARSNGGDCIPIGPVKTSPEERAAGDTAVRVTSGAISPRYAPVPHAASSDEVPGVGRGPDRTDPAGPDEHVHQRTERIGFTGSPPHR